MVDLPPPVGPTRAIVSPGRTFRVKSCKNRLAALVEEVDVVELDLAAQAAGSIASGRSTHFGHGVDQREHALAEAIGVLHLGIHARQVLDRPHMKVT